MCVCVRMNICSRYFFHKNKTLNYSGIQVFLSILSCLSIWQRKISHRFWLRLDIGEFQHGKVQRLGCLVGSWAAGMQMYMPVCLPEKTSWIQGGRIQDSRSQKEFLNPRGWGSTFKSQGSEKTSWTQGARIQDSRFQKEFLNPRGWGSTFKSQGSEKTSWTQGARDSRFKIPKRILESKGVGSKIQESRLRKNFLNPRS